jgi:hypothetical protein
VRQRLANNSLILSQMEPCGASGRPIPTIRAAKCVARRRHSREGPPPFHVGAAITAHRAGTLLTGLATAVGPASRQEAALC